MRRRAARASPSPGRAAVRTERRRGGRSCCSSAPTVFIVRSMRRSVVSSSVLPEARNASLSRDAPSRADVAHTLRLTSPPWPDHVFPHARQAAPITVPAACGIAAHHDRRSFDVQWRRRACRRGALAPRRLWQPTRRGLVPLAPQCCRRAVSASRGRPAQAHLRRATAQRLDHCRRSLVSPWCFQPLHRVQAGTRFQRIGAVRFHSRNRHRPEEQHRDEPSEQ